MHEPCSPRAGIFVGGEDDAKENGKHREAQSAAVEGEDKQQCGKHRHIGKNQDDDVACVQVQIEVVVDGIAHAQHHCGSNHHSSELHGSAHPLWHLPWQTHIHGEQQCEAEYCQ